MIHHAAMVVNSSYIVQIGVFIQVAMVGCSGPFDVDSDVRDTSKWLLRYKRFRVALGLIAIQNAIYREFF